MKDLFLFSDIFLLLNDSLWVSASFIAFPYTINFFLSFLSIVYFQYNSNGFLQHTYYNTIFLVEMKQGFVIRHFFMF